VLQPQDGGVAAHALQLASGLRARGWDIEVATPGSSAIVPALERAGVLVHDLPLVREPGRADISAARALRELDRRRGYGLVHAHSSKAGALVRAALPGRGRLVYTPHCFAFAARFGSARRLVYRTIEQLAVPRSGAIVAVCEWERAEALGLLGTRGVLRHIEYGVEACRGGEPDRALLEFKGDAPLAGMVSVLREQKDPLLAVHAAARLVSLGELPGRLAIVGNGPLEGEVQEEIERLGIGDRVRWFPFRGSVSPYLAALDLFVLPSAWEALPLSLLEAMSCGLPILATRVGGSAEAVQDGVTGRVVDHGDEIELALALRDLLADREGLRRLGDAGRAVYEMRFRVDRMLDDTEALYRELLAARGVVAPTIAQGNGLVRLT
jgi:glycosyltransferase involved in cell wall biosynthesis